MIHPSELTIGSLVTDEYYDTFKTIIKVESINDKGINLCIEDDGKWAEIAQIWIAPEYYTFDKLRGIPLTEDILIRCGFVLFSKTEFKISYNMPKHPFIEVIYNQTYHWHVRLYCSYRVDISSLHQLQNLVKLLCNQTIELK